MISKLLLHEDYCLHTNLLRSLIVIGNFYFIKFHFFFYYVILYLATFFISMRINVLGHLRIGS